MIVQSRIQLGELLKELNLTGPVAEIGVAEGLNARDILEQWDTPMLYLVDRWKHVNIKGDSGEPQKWHDRNLENVLKLVAPFKDRYQILQGNSVEMADQIPNESLSLVYLDGDHSYEGVMNDLTAWVSKVHDGGIIAGHDFLNNDYGVKQAVYDFCGDKYQVIIIPENNINDAGFYFIKQ